MAKMTFIKFGEFTIKMEQNLVLDWSDIVQNIWCKMRKNCVLVINLAACISLFTLWFNEFTFGTISHHFLHLKLNSTILKLLQHLSVNQVVNEDVQRALSFRDSVGVTLYQIFDVKWGKIVFWWHGWCCLTRRSISVVCSKIEPSPNLSKW